MAGHVDEVTVVIQSGDDVNITSNHVMRRSPLVTTAGGGGAATGTRVHSTCTLRSIGVTNTHKRRQRCCMEDLQDADAEPHLNETIPVYTHIIGGLHSFIHFYNSHRCGCMI